LKIGVPYRIIGGIKFYERAEVKDCVAYLKTVFQPQDDLAFERILNVPKRSIGDTTVKAINNFGGFNKFSLYIPSKHLIEQNKIKPKTKLDLNSLLNLLSKSTNYLNSKINHNKLLQTILN
jgi:Superfamily I DNA and RNA helicases